MSESSTRTSSGRWHAIATGVVGSLFVALAAARATIYWPEVVLHHDGLMLVALASTGGLMLGGATSRLSATRRRPRA